MIVRFENLLDGKSFNKNLRPDEIKRMKSRALWSVDNTIYWINKVIDFDSHVNVLVMPLYAWECMVVDNDWSLFDMLLNDDVYSKKLTDKLCVRHYKTEVGITNRAGHPLYLETLKFDAIPPVTCGDIFVFDEVVYVVTSFEIHRRFYGKHQLNRVAVVTHEVDKVFNGQTVINQHKPNPLKHFMGEFDHANYR